MVEFLILSGVNISALLLAFILDELRLIRKHLRGEK